MTKAEWKTVERNLWNFLNGHCQCKGCEESKDCPIWSVRQILKGKPINQCDFCGEFYEEDGEYCPECSKEYAEDIAVIERGRKRTSK